MKGRECLASAIECQQMACVTRDANERRIWLETAASWLRLAQSAEEQTHPVSPSVSEEREAGLRRAKGTFGRKELTRRLRNVSSVVVGGQVMPEERRRSPRHPFGRVAAIMFGSDGERTCLVKDYSDGGVRLHPHGFQVPDEFALLFAPNEPAQSGRYRVVWRLGRDVGAKFIGPTSVRSKDGECPS